MYNFVGYNYKTLIQVDCLVFEAQVRAFRAQAAVNCGTPEQCYALVKEFEHEYQLQVLATVQTVFLALFALVFLLMILYLYLWYKLNRFNVYRVVEHDKES